MGTEICFEDQIYGREDDMEANVRDYFRSKFDINEIVYVNFTYETSGVYKVLDRYMECLKLKGITEEFMKEKNNMGRE